MYKKPLEHRAPDSVEVVKVIKVEYVKGNGTEESPVRNAKSYYDIDGNFLFEKDGYEMEEAKTNEL